MQRVMLVKVPEEEAAVAAAALKLVRHFSDANNDLLLLNIARVYRQITTTSAFDYRHKHRRFCPQLPFVESFSSLSSSSSLFQFALSAQDLCQAKVQRSQRSILRTFNDGLQWKLLSTLDRHSLAR